MGKKEEHCCVNIHDRNKASRILGNSYYPPGGSYRGGMTARIEPSVDRDKTPPAMLSIFESGEDRSDWPHVIIDAAISESTPMDINPSDMSISAASRLSTDGNFHTPGTGSRVGEDINNEKGDDEDEP